MVFRFLALFVMYLVSVTSAAGPVRVVKYAFYESLTGTNEEPVSNNVAELIKSGKGDVNDARTFSLSDDFHSVEAPKTFEVSFRYGYSLRIAHKLGVLGEEYKLEHYNIKKGEYHLVHDKGVSSKDFLGSEKVASSGYIDYTNKGSREYNFNTVCINIEHDLTKSLDDSKEVLDLGSMKRVRVFGDHAKYFDPLKEWLQQNVGIVNDEFVSLGSTARSFAEVEKSYCISNVKGLNILPPVFFPIDSMPSTINIVDKESVILKYYSPQDNSYSYQLYCKYISENKGCYVVAVGKYSNDTCSWLLIRQAVAKLIKAT